MSPTQRSLKLMRDRGYLCEVVEKWIPGANIRRDLFGFIDILAIDEQTGFVWGIQATSYSNISARVRKIADHENIGTVRKARWALVVQGWRKVGNRWQVKEVDVS